MLTIAQYQRRKEELRLPVIKIENLEAEMKRNKISRSDIAHTLGLSYRTIGSYLFVSDRIRRGGGKTKPVRLYDWQKNLLLNLISKS